LDKDKSMAFLASMGAAGGAGAMGATTAQGAGLGSLVASAATDALQQGGTNLKDRPPIQYPQPPLAQLQQQQAMSSNIYPLLSLLK
jgi:hypothetical protein